MITIVRIYTNSPETALEGTERFYKSSEQSTMPQPSIKEAKCSAELPTQARHGSNSFKNQRGYSHITFSVDYEIESYRCGELLVIRWNLQNLNQLIFGEILERQNGFMYHQGFLQVLTVPL